MIFLDNTDKYKEIGQKIISDLKQEREITLASCLNLEYKNEQLKILINRLYNLANKREKILTGQNNNFLNTENKNDFLFKKSNFSEELTIALENSKKLENDIEELKNKLNIINEELSN